MLLCVKSERLSDEGRAELNEMREALGLSLDTDCYKVIAANRSPDGETIAIQTRSVLALMTTLGAYVDVPDADLESGVAPDIGTLDASASRLLRILSGLEPPQNPHVAVKYREHWFWIDHTDSDSKRTFAYLALFSNLAEAGSAGGAQLVLNVGRQVAGLDEADAAVNEAIVSLEDGSEDN